MKLFYKYYNMVKETIYIKQRDKILNDIIKFYNCSKDLAKELKNDENENGTEKEIEDPPYNELTSTIEDTRLSTDLPGFVLSRRKRESAGKSLVLMKSLKIMRQV